VGSPSAVMSIWLNAFRGCVTPKQIGNIIEQLGGLDGLDLDKDLDILDGYEELPPEHQDKIRYALENGHVNDDDWKGVSLSLSRLFLWLISTGSGVEQTRPEGHQQKNTEKEEW